MKSGQNMISISNADRVLLLMQVDTWKSPLPSSQSEAWAYSSNNPDFKEEVHSTNKLLKMSEKLNGLPVDYNTMFKPHVKAHGELFSRVKLDLNGGESRKFTSQEMLQHAVENDKMSLALTEKLYDACRYLIICSMGERPSNLQGIWTGTWSPAWSGDYTLDSNIQLEIQSQ